MHSNSLVRLQLGLHNVWIERTLWTLTVNWQLRFSYVQYQHRWSSITHGIGGMRCVKLLLLFIMSLNKHLQTNVLPPHAAESDETAVRKHPYPSWVSSNWRTTLSPLALFDRDCSITTPALNTAPALQYTVCNYNAHCCYTMTPQKLHTCKHSTHTCIYCTFACVHACPHVN